MPLRSPKPCYRIQTLKDRVLVQYWKQGPRNLIPGPYVEVSKTDKVAQREEIDSFVKVITKESGQ